MSLLKVGIVATSRKEHERRVPVHVDHLPWIEERIRRQMVFERGYGVPFGVPDERIASVCGGVVPRDELFEACDIIALPKPMHADLEQMRSGQVLWGWAHAVQDVTLAQIAIDRRLTLMTWESMNTWDAAGRWQSHIFRANNEIAGYAGVLHATGLLGITGHYGRDRRVVVTHYGSASRGAVRALRGLGFGEIIVLAWQLPTEPVEGVRFLRMHVDGDGRVTVAEPDGRSRPVIDLLATTDVIVNGILQDPDRPVMFVREGEADRLRPNSLVIDISCDAGMGFAFARPTTFEQPMFRAGPVHYYAVDHTPSYLWDSASWEISEALLPFLPVVLAGPAAWGRDETVRRAVEIEAGVVKNPKILSFQRRAAEYPHPRQ